MNRQEFQKRYKYNNLEHKIGGGSFGTVYKAYDRVLDRNVAIKVSEVTTIQDKEVSLQVEFDAIKSLAKHPNIANYESVHRFEDGPGIYDYAIMQYYPLGNLSNFIKKHQLNEKQKSHVLVQILEGLAYLHKKKVVHRDIKPGNILVVDRPNEGIVPKITDFGLSKLTDAHNPKSQFANSFAGGTVQYSSPEQLKGLPLKFNTDLWSFGVIIYEVFTGQSLFDTKENSAASVEWQSEVMQQILHKNLDNAFDELPSLWKKLAAQCLKRNSDERINTGQELLSQIPNELKNHESFSVEKVMDEAGTLLLDNTLNPNSDYTQLQTTTNNKTNYKVNSTKINKRKVGLAVSIITLAAIAAILLTNLPSSPSALARVELNGKTAFIDTKGKEVIPFEYTNGFSFNDGLAPVLRNGKWIYIDIEGQQAIEKEFEFAAPFSEELAAVKIGKSWGYINKKGTFSIAPSFELAASFSNGYAAVKINGDWGYIDHNGSQFIGPKFQAALEFTEGMAAVKKEGKWGYINTLGNTVIAYSFTKSAPFSNGLAAVSQGNSSYYIDKKGNSTINTEYMSLGNFSEGLAAVKTINGWGYIDKTGTLIIKEIFERAGNFLDGLAPVKKNNKWGFINTKGDLVIDYKYDYADNFSKNEN